jgi:hypothetical protein
MFLFSCSVISASLNSVYQHSINTMSKSLSFIVAVLKDMTVFHLIHLAVHKL